MSENKGLNIVVDDGSERVPIKNKFGDEIGEFYFRPTDVGIIDRFNKMASEFDKITEPLESVNINPDGTADGDSNDDAALTAFAEAEKRLYEACDYMFGGNLSEAFFGKMHPFSPVKGRFYCEQVLETVGQFITQQFARETQRINSRVHKYTHGYDARSGKHKGGKK